MYLPLSFLLLVDEFCHFVGHLRDIVEEEVLFAVVPIIVGKTFRTFVVI